MWNKETLRSLTSWITLLVIVVFRALRALVGLENVGPYDADLYLRPRSF